MSETADALALRVATSMRALEGTGPAFGIVIEEVREGYGRVSMEIKPLMLNGHGNAHGGLIFTLADTAFAYACNSRNQSAVAQQVSISYLRPAGLGDTLTAEATETTLAGRSGTYHLVVRNQKGEVVANAIGLARLVGGSAIPEA